MLLVNCLAAGLRVDTIRNTANHVPCPLPQQSHDLTLAWCDAVLASQHVKAVLNLLDKRLLEAPEAFRDNASVD